MRIHHLSGIRDVTHTSIDIDDLALELLRFLITSLFLDGVDQYAQDACGIGVKLTRFAEPAEQRAPHIRLAFAHASLLDFDAPLQRESQSAERSISPSAGLVSHWETVFNVFV